MPKGRVFGMQIKQEALIECVNEKDRFRRCHCLAESVKNQLHSRYRRTMFVDRPII